MKIILGVFESYTFEELKMKFDCTRFSLKWEEFNHNIESFLMDTSIIRKVYWAALEAEEIYFDLTLVSDNLAESSFRKSWVINELFTILTNPDFFEKTRFFKHGKELDKNKVFNDFIFNPFWRTI